MVKYKSVLHLTLNCHSLIYADKQTAPSPAELLLQPLRDICQSDAKGLDGRERVLEVKGVGVAVDAAKLHHLRKARKRGSIRVMS